MNLNMFVKKALLVTGIVASFVSLSSCDSKEDRFAKEETTFVIKSHKYQWIPGSEIPSENNMYDFRTDTFKAKSNQVLEYNVYLSKSLYVRFPDGTPFDCRYSECIRFDFYGLGSKSSNKLMIEDFSYSSTYKYPELLSHDYDRSNKGVFCFAGHNEYSYQDFVSDTSAALVNSADLYVKLVDDYGNTSTCCIKVNFIGNIPPIPVLKIEDIEGKPMGKKLDLGNSYDKDGRIMKYEFCIDGNVVDSYKYGTFETLQVASSGKGANGGTYITATDMSTLSHTFTEAGDHTIYYRCMDDKETWSVWKKEIVTVNNK